jgi:CHAT domain-containing protein
LTSKEILEMDFHGVKLVVLSACKTGLGNDTNLMGFSLGPQHAFKVKGANQLLMSLWMVDDAATSLLMQYFYEGILSGKEARYALQEAQHKMISSGYKDAYYWAGFIILD